MSLSRFWMGNRFAPMWDKPEDTAAAVAPPVVVPPVVVPPAVVEPPAVVPPVVVPPAVVPPAVVPPTDAAAALDAWRKDMAGDDPKLLAVAQRYNTKPDILKALVAAQEKIRTGNAKAGTGTPPPDGKDAAALAAWRKDNGLPEDWKGYGIEGLDRLPDEQRGLYEGFLTEAHSKHLRPDAVKEAVGIYRAMETKAIDERVKKDLADQESAIDTLEKDWGGRHEFKRNAAMSDNYLSSVLGEDGARLMTGRLADGTIAGNSPAIAKWIANLARDAGFSDTYVPEGGGGGGASIDDRIAQIKVAMGDGSYWKDAKMQTEYLRLTEARLNRDARGKK